MSDDTRAGEAGEAIVRVRLASHRQFLDPIHALAERFCEPVGFSDDEIYWCITAIREAVSNAVIHGNRERADSFVEVRLERSADRVKITVVDEGAGFEPDALPDPVSKEHLLDASGRGVYLMRQLMDEVSYTFPDEGGTCLEMVKIRSDGSDGES